ncbi:MAG TPA: FtsW/RodA/SpoVE family cell cycle protein, partial [Acidimicrobiales bacterium]|nr:FtsW/RodA/SpoVE family cell cycle protein [Acidimicrobiales bacterium]
MTVVAASARVGRDNPRRRSELGLLFVAVVVVVFAYLLGALGQSGQLPPNPLKFILGYTGLALFVHLVNRFLAPNCDPVVLPVIFVLNGIGYVVIDLLEPRYASNQLLWMVAGVFVYSVTLLVLRRSRDLERYRYLLGLAAFLLLALPLFPGIGGAPASVVGSSAQYEKLWIHIGTGAHAVSFQPIEVAKLLLVIFFASYFVEKRELLSLPTRRVGNHLIPDLRSFGPVF